MTLLLAITFPSHAYMLSIRGPSLAATVPSRPPISPKMSDQYIMSQNDKHLNPHITRLMMVRGGDEDSSDGDSYSDTDDEVEATVDTSEESKPTQNEIEVAQRQIALSSQSRNFGIATALWSSLFFDSIFLSSHIRRSIHYQFGTYGFAGVWICTGFMRFVCTLERF